MITEDYVSFEVAKLLKEKEFNESTCGCYHNDYIGTLLVSSPINHNGSINSASAPSLGHAMKWLREVHNILIAIEFTSPEDDSLGYNCYFEIYDYDVRPIKIGNGCYSTSCYSTYEEACEAAIKYCLENLI